MSDVKIRFIVLSFGSGAPGRSLLACIVAAVIGSAGLVGAPARAADPKASRFYEDALQRFEKKDLPGAVIQLKNALQIDKSLLPVHVLLGKVLLAQGELVAAEVALSEALRLGVNRAEVVVPLAQAVVNQGRPQDLLSDARFEVGGLPPDVQTSLLLVRAAAASDVGKVGESLRAIEQARALDPGRPESWLAEVPVRIRAREFTLARAAADKAVALAPNQAEALYSRGQVAHAQADLDDAQVWYGKALKAEPAHTEALVSRAGLWLDRNRLTEAQADVSALMRGSPAEPRGAYLQAQLAERRGDLAAARSAYLSVTNLLDPAPMEFLRYRPQLLMLGGLSHFSLRQFEKAVPYLELVQRQQPGSPVAKVLARIQVEQKYGERAAETLATYLRATPVDVQAAAMLASLYIDQKRYSRAVQVAQEGLRQRDDADLRALLGLSLLGSGKVPEAVVELEAVLAREPGQARAGTALVAVYQQSGQPARAARLAGQLLRREPRNAGMHILHGQNLAAAGDAAAARKAFEAALAITPDAPLAQIGLARLESSVGQVDAAVGRLNSVLAQHKDHPETLLELARLAERQNKLADAQRWLERADDNAGPDAIQAGLALVDFHLRHSQEAGARAALSRLTGKAPDSLPVLLASARVYASAGDRSGARAVLSRASGMAGFEPATLLLVARMQQQIGHLAGAVQSAAKLLAERPRDLDAQTLMAELELAQGETALAEKHARQIVVDHPRSGAGHVLLGDLAQAAGHSGPALEAFRKAQQVEPSSRHLARLFIAQLGSDAPGAQALAERWLDKNPGDTQVRRMLADSHAQRQQLPAAKRQYEALLRQRPDDAEALNNLANVLLLSGADGALPLAERAMALKPGAAHIIGTAGWAAFKAGQPDRALQLLRDARLRDPGNAHTRYFLGTVLAQAGRRAEAREELQAALKGSEQQSFAQDARDQLARLR